MAEHVLTVVVIGDSSVGKTSLLLRFTDDLFSVKTEKTLGVDCKHRRCKIGEIPIKLKIRDTAGQERYRSLTSSTYRDVQGVMLVYDMTSLDTFYNLKYWIEDVRKYSSADVIIILVGNKSDKSTEFREVTPDAATKFAKSQRIPYFIETSAKTSENVEEAFMLLAKEIIQHKGRKKESQKMKLRNNDSKQTKSNCC